MNERLWRKSTHSGQQSECIEVAIAADQVGIRDTKNRDAGYLAVSARSWSVFTARVMGNLPNA